MPVVEQLLASERLRHQVGQTAVPIGHCTEPSNVKAGGHACLYRYHCVGCEHFPHRPRKPARAARLPAQAAARPRTPRWRGPALADWARRDAAPSEQEITALRALIRRNDELIERLEPADRAAVLDAIAVTRRVRAQLAAEIPARLRAATPPAASDAQPSRGTHQGKQLVIGRASAMHGQRRLDAQLKRERVAAAVDAWLASGNEITIAGVARHARVSRKFIYSHPDLRAELELRALRATQSAGATGLANARVTGASLRADSENYKAQSHRLRQQVRTLEQRLSEILGRQLADALPHDERTDFAATTRSRRSSRNPRRARSSSKKHSPTRARSSTRSARSTASCSLTATDLHADETATRPATPRGPGLLPWPGGRLRSAWRPCRSSRRTRSPPPARPFSPQPAIYGIVIAVDRETRPRAATTSVTVSTITSAWLAIALIIDADACALSWINVRSCAFAGASRRRRSACCVITPAACRSFDRLERHRIPSDPANTRSGASKCGCGSHLSG